MLETAKIVGFIPTRDFAKAKAFYGGTLALKLVSEDPFAIVFEANGTRIRVAYVKEFSPMPFTILGWEVSGIEKIVSAITAKGATFEHYTWMEQDKLGIWIAPGKTKVAWFKDPDGNVLSLSEHPAT